MLENEHENFDEELRKEIKKEALIAVKSLLNSPEQLEQLDIFLAKEIKKEKHYEEQMQSFIKNHLENLTSTLKDLRIAMTEAGCLHSDFKVVKSLIEKYQSNEKKVEKLTSLSLKASTLSQSLFWLRQIIDMGHTIDEIKKMLDEMRLLEAHKKLRELEGVRDKIFSKHFENIKTQKVFDNTEKNLLAKKFEPISELESKLFDKVLYVLKNFIKYCQDDPSTLVTAIRIIEREEKVDEYWKSISRSNQNDNNYVPDDRPKCLASNVDLAICDQFHDKIKEIKSKINFDDKLALTEYLELIRTIIVKDLTILQNKGLRCFPPTYQILPRVCRIYHDTVSKCLLEAINTWKEPPKEINVAAVLLFVKSYTEDQMFGNPKFDPIILQTIRNCIPLLDAVLLQRFEHIYLVNVCENLTKKVSRIIAIEKRDMEGDSPPKVIDKKYQTLMHSFYDDFVGVKITYSKKLSIRMFLGVFKYCIVAFEQFLAQYEVLFEQYVNEQFQLEESSGTGSGGFSNFVNLFKNVSHNNPFANKFPHFVNYCIAIANNCILIKQSVDQLITDIASELEKKPENSRSPRKTPLEWIGEDFANRISCINSQIEDFSKKCIVTITNDYFFDLANSFDVFLTNRWQENAAEWSQGFYDSLQVFCELLEYLDNTYIDSVMSILDMGIAKRYLTRFLTHKAKYDHKQLTVFGEFIYNDGNFLTNFFSQRRSIDQKKVFCYTIVMCGSVFKTVDLDCALIDAAKLFKTYCDFNSDHANSLLSKRGDLSKDKINETIKGIIESRKSGTGSHSGVFSEIHIKKTISLL